MFKFFRRIRGQYRLLRVLLYYHKQLDALQWCLNMPMTAHMRAAAMEHARNYIDAVGLVLDIRDNYEDAR